MTDKRRELDWSGAEVDDGAATLVLTGEASKDWAERFSAVATLLAQKGSARWGEVKVTRKAVKVAELQPGAEDDLRHFLESVVAQVNSELGEQPDVQATQDEQDPQAARDAESADKLRSFSGERQD
jgi:hypothetical protein